MNYFHAHNTQVYLHTRICPPLLHLNEVFLLLSKNHPQPISTERPNIHKRNNPRLWTQCWAKEASHTQTPTAQSLSWKQTEVNSVWAAFWAGKVSGQIRKRWYCVSSAEHWLCGYWPRGDWLSSLLRLGAVFYQYVVLHDTNRFPNSQLLSAYRPPPPISFHVPDYVIQTSSYNRLYSIDCDHLPSGHILHFITN